MSIANDNLYAHFELQFEKHAEKELLRDTSNGSYRYADISARSAQIANHLISVGATQGDRISVQVDKSVECLCLYLACLRAGLVFHPMNMAYVTKEVEYFVGNAEPAVIVRSPEHQAHSKKLAKQAGVKQILTLDAAGHGTLSSGADAENASFDTVACNGDELAALLYSSGTTGQPKGIMLTHANLLRNTESLVLAWRFTESDRLLHALPIFHVHGLFVAIGCVLLSGSSMRWLPGFDAKTIVQYLPECTVMMGVPTYYTRLLATDSFGPDVVQNMRVFISGSAPLLEETFAEFETRTGHRILERYGMTETNMNTSNPLDGVRKAGTVGPPLPGVEVRIVDDSDNPVAQNEIGNLQVRGPNVFSGYWKMPEKTAEDIGKDRFFNTGDKGKIDGDGYVSIVGRAKDMVITGGLNVYPKEVELVIDDIAGVKESAVIGIPHADFGEAVVAVVVPTGENPATPESILAACKRELANYKVPKKVRFLDELPRNTMAKVQKNALRETFQHLFE